MPCHKYMTWHDDRSAAFSRVIEKLLCHDAQEWHDMTGKRDRCEERPEQFHLATLYMRVYSTVVSRPSLLVILESMLLLIIIMITSSAAYATTEVPCVLADRPEHQVGWHAEIVH